MQLNRNLVVTVKYWLPPILDGTPQFFCYIIVVTVKYWLPPILDGTPQIFCNILVVVIVKYWLPPIWDGTPQIFCYSIVVTVGGGSESLSQSVTKALADQPLWVWQICKKINMPISLSTGGVWWCDHYSMLNVKKCHKRLIAIE